MRAGAGTRPSRRDMTVLTLPETKIPDELARTLVELPVPLAAVLRAAHAKVRAELTGERESTARYPTWRSLVLAANDGDLPVEPPLDVRDADAARIAGYHSRALELIAADPSAPRSCTSSCMGSPGRVASCRIGACTSSSRSKPVRVPKQSRRCTARRSGRTPS